MPLDEVYAFWKQRRLISVRNCILRKAAIVGQSCHLLIQAHTDIRTTSIVFPRTTAIAFPAGMLEQQHTYSLAEFPLRGGRLTKRHDGSDGFVRACERSRRAVNALIDLEICVAEAGCGDLDEDLIVCDLRNGNGFELILLVVLRGV